jgi:hypothetical protein
VDATISRVILMIKKGDSSFNVVFKGEEAYTNKLYARNISLQESDVGATLQVEFKHYSKRKRKNLEDSDFDRLLKQKDQISHFVIRDATVLKGIEGKNIVRVDLILSDTDSVRVSVTTLDKVTGFLR